MEGIPFGSTTAEIIVNRLLNKAGTEIYGLCCLTHRNDTAFNDDSVFNGRLDYVEDRSRHPLKIVDKVTIVERH
ncbi:hypothetical protein D3C76_1689860 [compost metagenome]